MRTIIFSNCTSLEYAPVLPAKNLTEACYWGIFSNCTLLSNIKMLATNIDAKDCLKDWLKGAAARGTFRKNKDAHWENENIVPQGWTVELINPNEEN